MTVLCVCMFVVFIVSWPAQSERNYFCNLTDLVSKEKNCERSSRSSAVAFYFGWECVC